MGDRISHIPDDLLLHILSSRSLQTEDVVATSLLSKRWRFLWHSILKLEFHDMRFDRYESFLQFVDSTLNLVDLKSVKMFVVRCDHFMFDFEGSEEYYEVICGKVDSWLNTVLKSKLEFLNLWFARGFDFLIRVPLPSSIFKCSSIKILKLTRVSVSDLSDVNLPSLKTLELSSVDFSNPGSLTVLLSKCVRLEELFLMYLKFLDDEMTTLNIGKLPNLVIAYVPVELFSMEAFSNVTCLCFHEDNVLNDYEFPTFSTFYNLSYLEIDLSQNGWTSMFSCLPSFPKLETLKIREGGKGLDWSVETSPDIPPCISTHLKTFALYFFNYLQSEFEIVRFIMKNATVLRSLIIVTRSYSAKVVKRLYSSEEHETERLHLVEILSSYPKCSQNCCIFVDDAVKGVSHKMYGKLTSVRSDAECLFSYFGLW